MKQILIATLMICMTSATIGWAGSVDQQVDREKCLAIQAIHQRHERSLKPQVALTLPTFPSGHPDSGYFFGQWVRWDDETFNIYVWRENGYVWVEIEPTSEDPFICSSSFSIIQEQVQYDSVKLVTITGDSQCSEVYVPSVFWLSQWSHLENVADLNKDFTLVYDGIRNNYSMEITGDPNYSCGDVNDDGVVDSTDLYWKAYGLYGQFRSEYSDWKQNCWDPAVKK